MSDDDLRQSFLDHLSDVVGEHGEPDHPPDDYPDDVEEASTEDMAKWLLEAALYLTNHSWEESVDSAFGTDVPRCSHNECGEDAPYAIHFGDGSRGVYCESHKELILEDTVEQGFRDEVTVRGLDWA